ncbi:hypothetical protein CVT26_009096 [Gymnopilus dilepis]|uniref:Major facilitator superfamily (MFS) profile domain-containing protein n=1 Tax=Gymnopilus dilepis TaxID=231916 RepID=A0A409WCI2_9AGAR|nr:hypothetical protein CVT26_009096 [Gymnopilus dilepis]
MPPSHQTDPMSALVSTRTSVLVENLASQVAPSDSQESVEKTMHLQGKKELLEYLASASDRPTICFSADEEKQLLRKIDRHVIPIIFLISFLNLLDVKGLSSSAVFGLSQDAHLSGAQYSMLGSVSSAVQLIFLPISTYFLVKIRLSLYVPVLVTGWGISLMCMGAAQNFKGLLLGRIFLGIFQAPVQASFILTLQVWYRRTEQGFRLAFLFSSIGWVSILGSLIMFGIGHIKSHTLHPYQIISFILGSVTLIIGFLSSIIFSNPSFSLAKKKSSRLRHRLRANQQGLGGHRFEAKQAWEMIKDIKSWCWMIMFFTAFVPVSGFAVFGPLIIKGFGFDGNHVMLLMMPYGALQIIFIFGGFWINRRFRLKAPIIICGLVPCIASAIVFLRVKRSHDNQPILLFAYYLTSIFAVVPATIVNWQASNVAGDTKKSATTTFMHVGAVAGEIVGPFVFSQKKQGNYSKGIFAMLVCYAACVLLAIFTIIYLWYLNKMNQRRRVARGKAGIIIDYSMLSALDAEKQRMRTSGGTGGLGVYQVGTRAFDDLTDLENDEFIVIFEAAA